MPSHPYRDPDRRDEPPRRAAFDPLRIGSTAALVFLFGWSLVRLALCTLHGLDIEGVLAVVVVVTTAIALVAPSRPESSS